MGNLVWVKTTISPCGDGILLVLRVVYLDSGNVSIQETTFFSHNLNGK